MSDGDDRRSDRTTPPRPETAWNRSADSRRICFRWPANSRSEDTRCTSFMRGRPSKCTPSGRHRLAVVAPVERPSPIEIAAGRFGIFSRVFKPERAESLFQPRIQAFLTAPIEQFGKYRIHERFEMVRVTYSGASKGIPDVGEFAVFDAVDTNIGHPARLLRSLRTISARVGATLNNIEERLFRNSGAGESLAADADP